MSRSKKGSNGLTQEMLDVQRRLNQRLRQPNEADRVAQALGEEIHSRALEMSPDEWAGTVTRFKELSPAERVFCFGAACGKCDQGTREGYARAKLVQQHLGAIVVGDFGVPLGEGGLGAIPRVPEGM